MHDEESAFAISIRLRVPNQVAVAFLDGAFDRDGWNVQRQMIQDCELVTLGGERIALITVGGMRAIYRCHGLDRW